ncbi:MAG: hypothetical protein HY000_23085 [Planctomycetes bacterium]|nr:hypothetical protein [Planctomycetota bacterium]
MAIPSHAIESLRAYAAARQQLLAIMNRAPSCRDPLAEFAEWIVAYLLDAEPAVSRVQRGYDLVRQDGRRVQVKYLANACPDRWVNEHTISCSDEIDQYALVIFEGFALSAVLVFDRSSLARIGQRLGKRHANQHCMLQLTRRNFLAIKESPEEFAALGVTTTVLSA